MRRLQTGSSDLIGMESELRAVALDEPWDRQRWSGQFADSERHVTEGATLAQAIGRPYIEVASCLSSVSVTARLAHEGTRARCQALALGERYGLSDRSVLAPRFGAVATTAVWMGEFEEGERWLRRGWDVVRAGIGPAVEVLLHMVTGMLHAGRGERRSALEALSAAVQAQSLLSGVHILAPVIAEWLARLGMPDEARATLDEFATEHEWIDAVDLARAAIRLAEGDPAAALAVLGDAQRMVPPPGSPAYGLVEAHLLTGLAESRSGRSERRRGCSRGRARCC